MITQIFEDINNLCYMIEEVIPELASKISIGLSEKEYNEFIHSKLEHENFSGLSATYQTSFIYREIKIYLDEKI